jgi:hypothetical protein
MRFFRSFLPHQQKRTLFNAVAQSKHLFAAFTAPIQFSCPLSPASPLTNHSLALALSLYTR